MKTLINKKNKMESLKSVSPMFFFPKLYESLHNIFQFHIIQQCLFSGVSAILEACSTYNLTQFQSERGSFSEKVREKVVEKYDVLHCDITDLQV